MFAVVWCITLHVFRRLFYCRHVTHTHTHTHTHIRMHTHTHTHTHKHTHTHTHTQTHTHAGGAPKVPYVLFTIFYWRRVTHTPSLSLTHTHTHTQKNTLTRIHTLTQTHKHTHTHTGGAGVLRALHNIFLFHCAAHGSCAHHGILPSPPVKSSSPCRKFSSLYPSLWFFLFSFFLPLTLCLSLSSWNLTKSTSQIVFA